MVQIYCEVYIPAWGSTGIESLSFCLDSASDVTLLTVLVSSQL